MAASGRRSDESASPRVRPPGEAADAHARGTAWTDRWSFLGPPETLFHRRWKPELLGSDEFRTWALHELHLTGRHPGSSSAPIIHGPRYRYTPGEADPARGAWVDCSPIVSLAHQALAGAAAGRVRHNEQALAWAILWCPMDREARGRAESYAQAWGHCAGQWLATAVTGRHGQRPAPAVPPPERVYFGLAGLSLADWLKTNCPDHWHDSGLEGQVVALEVMRDVPFALRSIAHQIRDSEPHHCLDALRDALWTLSSAPDQPTSHGPGFEWIEVNGTRYEFTRPQARQAVAYLWSLAGKPVHEAKVGQELGLGENAEDVARFRLRDVFRTKAGMNPAFGEVIVSSGPRTRMYMLRR